MKIEHVSPEQISANRIQPPNRGTSKDKSLKRLEASIRGHGILTPLHTVKSGSNYVLIDGHRRLFVAESIKLKTVPIVVDGKKKDPEELIAIGIGTTKAHSSYDGFYMWGAASPAQKRAVLQQMPASQQDAVMDLVALVGSAEATRIACDRLARPTVSYRAREVCAIYDAKMKGDRLDPEQVCKWMVACKMSGTASRLKRSPTMENCRKLKRRIEAGLPFAVQEWR